jgi:hypothetical protein
VKGDEDLEAGVPRSTAASGSGRGLMAAASAKRREVVSQVQNKCCVLAVPSVVPPECPRLPRLYAVKPCSALKVQIGQLAYASASRQLSTLTPSSWSLSNRMLWLLADAGHSVAAHLARHCVPHGAALRADGQLHTPRRIDGLRPGTPLRRRPRRPQPTWHIDHKHGLFSIGVLSAACIAER